jgi:hypothetical protein
MATQRNPDLIYNEFGAFCPGCGELMSIEEEDWGCAACGGEGFGEDDDYDYYDYYDYYDAEDAPSETACVTKQDTTAPELKQVLAEALAARPTNRSDE